MWNFCCCYFHCYIKQLKWKLCFSLIEYLTDYLDLNTENCKAYNLSCKYLFTVET